MTRTRLLMQACRDRAADVRNRLSARAADRRLVYLGAGLVLAGAGAVTVVGLVGNTATVPGSSDGLGRSAESVIGSQPGGPADERINHAVTRGAKPPTHVSQRPAHHAKPGATRQATSAGGTAGPTATHGNTGHGGGQRRPARDETWLQVERAVASATIPSPGHGSLPAQDKLTPTGTSGPQQWMPITPARYQNATTIVRQALAKKMGLRSAVIAVATAMQESTLLNINYGDLDSVGLFQQRPSAGWGTASQILHPVYAANAFLNALRTYQANNPRWASQPLWQPAQGVQASGVPYAYAKWEAQAAQLVGAVTRRLV